jgi:hypothetical protein
MKGGIYMTSEITKEAVEKAIKNSDSLITALEAVAAMYQIPAENIVVDDRANSIQVQGDTILAPDRPNPSANTKAIVCAIGAVLDNISQRVNEKLDNYQADQIEKNKLNASQKTPDPSKGEVISRHFDSDGNEIIVYSSGLVDMENTPAANAKVAELRSQKLIPDYVSEPSKPKSYFTDEDDIMNNLPTASDSKIDLEKATHDISENIHECAFHVDLFDKHHGSTCMGYEEMQSLGFDYVDKTHTMIQEAAKQPKAAKAEDLRYMKFDNKNIFRAVKLINEARNEIETKDFDFKELIRKPKFQSAIKLIESQFDCHLAVRFFDVRDKNGRKVTDGYTPTYNDVPQPVSISKAKGFQLHGLPIDVILAGDIVKINPAQNDREMYGQAIMSIILHEIWHNISAAIRKETDGYIAVMASAVMLASSTDNIKSRRAVLTNAINAITATGQQKIGRFVKRKLVKQLMSIAATKYNENAIEELKREVEKAGPEDLEHLDRYMERLQSYVSQLNEKKKASEKSRSQGSKSKAMFIIGIVLTCTGILAPIGLILCIGALVKANDGGEYAKQVEAYLNRTNKEEYYADLFAGMYNLPQAFAVGGLGSKLTPNQVDTERLNRLAKLERELGTLVMDPHPSATERSYAGMKIAKALLESKEKLDPSVKKYCEWIVENYSSLEQTNVKEIFSDQLFDPKEAENLDEHLQKIAKGGGVTVTESAKLVSKISRPRRW